MSSKANVLLFGATGLIGTYIFQELMAARSSFGQLGIFTSENTARNKPDLIKSLQEQGVKVIVGDLTNKSDVTKAYEGFDTVVSALGRGALPHQLELIKWAESSPDVQRFIPSEYGTDIEFNASSANEKPHQNKLKVRAYIKTETKSLNGFYLVTGPYVEGYIAASSAGGKIGTFDVKNKRAVLIGSPTQQIAFSTMRDVGRYLVGALLAEPPATRYPAYKVCSFVTTQQEILDEYEKQTGEKWDVQVKSLDEMHATEQQLWNEESPAATPATLRRIWAEGGTIYEKWDNDKFGLKTTDDLVGAVAASIKSQTSS